MIHQTLNAEGREYPPFILNGEAVNMGEISNVFRNKDLSKSIKFSFTFFEDKYLKKLNGVI